MMSLVQTIKFPNEIKINMSGDMMQAHTVRAYNITG